MIYYTASNGTIIGGTTANEQSSLQGITHLPSGADYAIYVDDQKVTDANPNNVPGTYSFTNVTTGPTLNVPTATGIIQFTEQPLADQLSSAQAAKITELQTMFAQTISGGFNSSATGTQYLYGFADSDQTNLGQELNMINAGLAIEPIAWGIKSGTVVNHTIAQFKQMCADGNRFKWAQVNQLRSLLGQVESATTVSGVNAIQWTPGTY